MHADLMAIVTGRVARAGVIRTSARGGVIRTSARGGRRRP